MQWRLACVRFVAATGLAEDDFLMPYSLSWELLDTTLASLMQLVEVVLADNADSLIAAARQAGPGDLRALVKMLLLAITFHMCISYEQGLRLKDYLLELATRLQPDLSSDDPESVQLSFIRAFSKLSDKAPVQANALCTRAWEQHASFLQRNPSIRAKAQITSLYIRLFSRKTRADLLQQAEQLAPYFTSNGNMALVSASIEARKWKKKKKPEADEKNLFLALFNRLARRCA